MNKYLLCVHIIVCILVIGCSLPRSTLDRSYQPPPIDSCQNIDLGPGVETYDSPLKLTEEESVWLKDLKSFIPEDMIISPRLNRLAHLMNELDHKGCDLNDDDLQGLLYSHVGLSSYINQMKSSTYWELSQPPFAFPMVKAIFKRWNKTLNIQTVGIALKTSWITGNFSRILWLKPEITLDPTPRHTLDRITYKGQVLEGRSALGFYVKAPDGHVHSCYFNGYASKASSIAKCTQHIEDHQRVEAQFICDQPGQYQVEFTASHPTKGPTPVANLRVWCGSAQVPTTFSGPIYKKKFDPKTFQQSEKDFIRWVNKARKKHDLPPLKYDEALSKVARDYSTFRMKTKCSGHRCGGTTPWERTYLAGLPFTLSTGENAGKNSSLLNVHKGLMGSPAHRSLTLSTDHTMYGVGVAIKDYKNGQQSYYVTELYQSDPLDRTTESCQKILQEKISKEYPKLSVSSPYTKQAQTLISEYALLNEITEKTKKEMAEQQGPNFQYYYYKNLKSFGQIRIQNLINQLKSSHSTQIGVACALDQRNHQDRWFVLVRYDQQKQSSDNCEEQISEKLVKLRPSSILNLDLKPISDTIVELTSNKTLEKGQINSRIRKKICNNLHCYWATNLNHINSLKFPNLIGLMDRTNAKQFVVSCQRNDDGPRSTWNIAVHYDKNPITQESCESHVLRGLNRLTRRTKPSQKLHRKSEEIAEYIAQNHHTHSTKQLIKDIKENYGKNLIYRWWNTDSHLSLSSLKSLTSLFEQNNALEYGVSCQKIREGADPKLKWTTVVHLKQSPITQKKCQTYLQKELKRQLPKLKFTPSLVKTSYQIAQIAAHRKRTKATIQSMIKDQLNGTKSYRWVKNKKYPTKINLKKTIQKLKKDKSTKFAVSCLSYKKGDQKKWAVAIYYE